ncbi:selenium cofactor biosynthesis protein YqeC [Sporosalibacterium faouarense]|uniref:selenium cofactor biosynthesis protein YqeC n=1 Tax=Sporosalibacterium faouarense TaxID=516123 RepID=UPI00141C9A29|nr:selenium cofactor biosynthesis protein YqeC [Sporosalibacterium faouarense]MTI48630.1 putative selenium-dependent hydroxylase accessory protein YqeC [Bacillota bacterium]
MEICEAFGINLDMKEMVCLVGGGGKTSTMFMLAKKLKNIGKKVLVSTTTAIYEPIKDDYDELIINLDSKKTKLLYGIPKRTITVIGSEISSEGKLLGLDKETMNKLFRENIFDYIIIESDGAKRKSIKAPASHEPVIPDMVTKVIGVIGLDSMYKKINEENVHRPNILCNVVETEINDIIDEEIIVKLVLSQQGLFKSSPKKSNKVLFLNKAEEGRAKYGNEICKKLLGSRNTIDRIVVGSNFKRKYEVFI